MIFVSDLQAVLQSVLEEERAMVEISFPIVKKASGAFCVSLLFKLKKQLFLCYPL